jgi:putative molybdopterin biosynthesis protein
MDLMTTAEAAAYLRLKERKLYELAASGGIPCTKATGKWLFPKPALDRWLLSGLPDVPAFVAQEPPAIVGGSHDPLLEWALRESRSGLAILAEGSEGGLQRFRRGEVAAAAIHLHDVAGASADWNIETAKAQPGFPDAVLVGFAKREQGLLIAPDNPHGVASFADVAANGLRYAHRPSGAGAQLLARRLARQAGLRDVNDLAGPQCATGADLAAAIRNGHADAGVASRSVATASGLHFTPILWERFDLILRGRDLLRPPFQALLALMRSGEFRRRAHEMTGYDVLDAGAIRYAP